MGCVSSSASRPQTIFSSCQQIELLQRLENQLTRSDDSCTMLTKEFWPHLFASFKDHYMNKDETLEFLDNLKNFIQFNFQGQYKIGETQVGITDFGEKFHKIENQLYFKRKRAEKYLKFISKSNETQQFEQNSFCDFKFDLSQDEVLGLAAKVRPFFQQDNEAFAFLSLYLQRSVAKSLESKTWETVEKQYTEVLKLLEKKYPANSSEPPVHQPNAKAQVGNQSSNGPKKTVKPLKDEEKFEQVKFEQGKSAYETLQSYIISKSREAAKMKEEIDKLFKQLCYDKGYGYKSGVKIKSDESKESIFRTIEKLIEDEMITIEVDEKQKIKTFSRDQLNQLLLNQKVKAQLKIQKILQSKSSILFKAKDLLRGKSTFEKIEDIQKCRDNVITKIWDSKGKIQIIEEKDKLNGKTKDLVLINKLGTVISEFQLVLKLDSASNEFNHKIYELQRSKVYSMIPNLFIHNQKWCKNFFGEQINLINDIVKSGEKKNGDEVKDMKSQERSSQKQIEAFLTLLQSEGHQKIKESQRNLEQKEIIKRVESIESVVKMEIEKKGNLRKKEVQKLNEIKYFINNHNLQKAKQMMEVIESIDEEFSADLMYCKGEAYLKQGRLKQALENYNKCLEIRVKIKGADSIDVTGALNNIGSVYSKQGDYVKALEHYNKLLGIQIKIQGADSIDVVGTLNNIGMVYSEKEDYVKALEYYNNCLEIQIQIQGADSIVVARTLENIGIVYSKQGDYVKALENYNKCLEIKMKIKGADSIDVAQSLNNIGIVSQDQGDYVKALEHYNKCLEIRVKIKGADSIDVAATLNNIGILYSKQGDYVKALEHYNKCLEIRAKINGADAIDVAATLNNIGILYQNQGNYVKALEHYNKCLEIRVKIKGADSIDVAKSFHNIGNVYQKLGHNDKALEQYNFSLKIEIQIKGAGSIDVAITLEKIGIVYQNQGDFLKALEHYNKCLEVRKQIFGLYSQKVQDLIKKIEHISIRFL